MAQSAMGQTKQGGGSEIELPIEFRAGMSATGGPKSSLVRNKRSEPDGKIEQGFVAALPADE